MKLVLTMPNLAKVIDGAKVIIHILITGVLCDSLVVQFFQQ